MLSYQVVFITFFNRFDILINIYTHQLTKNINSYTCNLYIIREKSRKKQKANLFNGLLPEFVIK